MARYKLTKKSNPLNPAKDGHWHAEPSPAPRMTSRELCRLLTQDTTLSAAELGMGLEMLSDRLPRLLAQGYSVQIGRLGSLRIEFGSEGVAEPEDFDYRLIRRPRIVFRPSAELRRELAEELSYELHGLVADGISFNDIASYRKWQEGHTAPTNNNQPPNPNEI